MTNTRKTTEESSRLYWDFSSYDRFVDDKRDLGPVNNIPIASRSSLGSDQNVHGLSTECTRMASLAGTKPLAGYPSPP